MSDSYYGRPILKAPVWTPEVPVYFFTGGMAGASSALAWLADLNGEEELARRAWAVALAAGTVSPVLLISDLGRPARFLNMLRMFKVTSPMSVGSWILAAAGATIAPSCLNALTGLLPRWARRTRPAAALLGLPLATYTGALIANTSIPVWHEARKHLPFLFGAGAAASAGAALVVITPAEHAAPARRLALWGAVAEVAVGQAMERQLGDLGEPYRTGDAGRYSRIAEVLTALGAAVVGARASRSRAAAIAGGTAILAGALAERWSVYRAGFQSAADPKYVVEPQRARLERTMT